MNKMLVKISKDMVGNVLVKIAKAKLMNQPFQSYRGSRRLFHMNHSSAYIGRYPGDHYDDVQ